MTVMESGSEILKVDEVGRVRTPLEKREAMLAEYERNDRGAVREIRGSEVFDANVLAAEGSQGSRSGSGKGKFAE